MFFLCIFALQGEKMETRRNALLTILESLREEEFKKFKWCLEDKVLGFPGIPESRLQKADRMDTVQLMLQHYGTNTIKVTREVLKKIPRNDLENKLSESSSDPEGRSLKKSLPKYNFFYFSQPCIMFLDS